MNNNRNGNNPCFSNLPILNPCSNMITSSVIDNGWSPQTSFAFGFFKRYALQNIFSVWKFKYANENVCDDYVKYTLFLKGFLGVAYHPKYGVMFQESAIYGYDMYYNPTDFQIVNQFVSLQRKIGYDGEILRFSPDWGTLNDLLDYYASLFAEASNSIIVNLRNTKITRLYEAENKQDAERFKLLLEQALNGFPAVVTNKDDFTKNRMSWFTQDAKSNFIAPDLLALSRNIMREFFAKIGVPSINSEKKERLITDEITANSGETMSLCSLWMSVLKECEEKINKMFGSGTFEVSYNEEVVRDVTVQTDTVRNV